MTATLRRLFAYMLALALTALPAGTLAVEIALVLSKRSASQTEFVDALRKELPPSADIRLTEAGTADESLDEGALARADLLIAVGSDAASVLAPRNSPPILAVMISNHNLSTLQARHSKARIGGIVLDQPLSRHMRLVRAALPSASRIGVLLGPQSAAYRGDLLDAATREGLAIQFEQIEDVDGLLAALERLLGNCDAILAVPDAVAFSAATARPILLTTYRYRKPMLGYSQAYVTAGALTAVFSAPDDVARQVADWLRRTKGRFEPSGAEPPRDFSVAVNRHVARALGIPLPDEAVLEATIDKRRQP